jgi:CheY-like chemotaxis protein
MKWSKVSMYYYPTTAVFVDDQISFLNELDLGLDKSIVRKLYNDPKELVKNFGHYSGNPFINKCIISDEDAEYNEGLITHHADIKLLHTAIYNPNRFDEVSILVADYAMPGTNGLDCCRAIQDKYIKKMLLTGEADSNIAVAAFNEGIIDKFIQKGKPEQLIGQVNESVHDLQMQYFLDLSDKFKGMTVPSQITQSLNDSIFTELFYNQGSFLMLDKEAKPYWLIIKNEQEIENLYQFAKFEQAPLSVLDALKSREKIPYFHSDKDFKTPPDLWDSFMHPAKKLTGKETYYYSFLSAMKAFPLKKNKVVSYQQYLNAKS